MSNATARRNAIEQIFESYEFAHKKLNEDFALFKSKVHGEITQEDEHAARLAELASTINTQKLDGVKEHLADLGAQVQQYMDEYADKVARNNEAIDAIYRVSVGSLAEVCNIRKIMLDIDTEICKFLDFVDRQPVAANELLFDTGAAASGEQQPGGKWLATDALRFACTASGSSIVNELRIVLVDRPYVRAEADVPSSYEPQYVDRPALALEINGSPVKVRAVTLHELGRDRFELVALIDSTVMEAGDEYAFEVASDCTMNVRMIGDGEERVPAARLFGAVLHHSDA